MSIQRSGLPSCVCATWAMSRPPAGMRYVVTPAGTGVVADCGLGDVTGPIVTGSRFARGGGGGGDGCTTAGVGVGNGGAGGTGCVAASAAGDVAIGGYVGAGGGGGGEAGGAVAAMRTPNRLFCSEAVVGITISAPGCSVAGAAAPRRLRLYASSAAA